MVSEHILTNHHGIRLNQLYKPSSNLLTLSNLNSFNGSTFPSKNSQLPYQIKLDSSNYNYWKVQVLPTIHALELDAFISGLKVFPPKLVAGPVSADGEQTIVPNPAYTALRRAN
ncbi:hypothetical protein ACOSP7_013881 [Xanthoceras sorbifolium]